MQIRIIEQEKEAEAVSRKLFGKRLLPPFLYGNFLYDRIVAGLFEGTNPVGIEYGVMKKGEDLFFIHGFYIKPEFRKMNLLEEFLTRMLDEAKCSYHVKCVFWKYEWTKEKDPYEAFIHRCGKYRMEKLTVIQRFRVKTKDFDYLRQFHWYYPDLMEKKGYHACLWKNYPGQEKEKIRKQEQEGNQETVYLSPFVENEDWEPDPASCYVLVKNETREPCGWIICEKVLEHIVRLRRFYICKDKRLARLGPAFSTYVLDRIAEIYEEMLFDVVVGNQQMERVASRQFGPIMQQKCYLCNSRIYLEED